MEKRECMVCLDEFLTFITLPCNHEICVVCYPRIVELNSVCPICRCDFKEIRGEYILQDVPMDEPRLVVVQPVRTSVYDERKCVGAIFAVCCFLLFLFYGMEHLK